jgi:flagellar biosynthetic protein FliR
MLQHFLLTEIFAFLLIFCRLGSAFMLLPGFGELYVPPRVRLAMALLFSLTLTPVLHALPPVPDTVFGLFRLLVAEILVGIFLGGLSRFLISAMHIAGTVIAYQSSLASALTQGITQFSGQDTSLGNFLSMSAVTLIFATDLHYLMLRGLADSYTLFLPGQFPPVEDFANHATHMVSGAFRMAMQMAAPNIVVGLMMSLGAGLIARLVPNIQIFFLMMAPQLLISFSVLMITFSAIMMWYMDYFRETLGTFLAP